MRTTVTIVYLLVMTFAITLIKLFEPPTDRGLLLMAGLATAWILTLPWSLLTFLVMWWFMHDSSNPIFLVFFAFASVLNALLLNLNRIRDWVDMWRWKRGQK
jgi:hypothetical protein